jgi:hypothetical protein
MTRRTIADALSGPDKDDLLNAEDHEQIRAKAREHVKKKRRDAAEAKQLAKYIRDEEVAHNPLEQSEDVRIDLAPFVASEKLKAACITIDGTIYIHGQTYTVPYSVARTLEDIMARGWEHENEIHGFRRKNDVNRRPVNPVMRPGQESQSRVNTRASIGESVSI